MISVMSLATSCRVLDVGSVCRSMASTQSGARGSPGQTGNEGIWRLSHRQGTNLDHKHVHHTAAASSTSEQRRHPAHSDQHRSWTSCFQHEAHSMSLHQIPPFRYHEKNSMWMKHFWIGIMQNSRSIYQVLAAIQPEMRSSLVLSLWALSHTQRSSSHSRFWVRVWESRHSRVRTWTPCFCSHYTVQHTPAWRNGTEKGFLCESWCLDQCDAVREERRTWTDQLRAAEGERRLKGSQEKKRGI